VALVPDPVVEDHETDCRHGRMDFCFKLGETAAINLHFF